MKKYMSDQMINLNNDDISKINELSKEQTKKYGHDSGDFSLGRKDSSHKIGFVGEIGFLRYLKEKYNLREPSDIGLEKMGDKFDVFIKIQKNFHKIHVKTGRWSKWPEANWTFGVHWDQKIESSKSPVVLIGYLKDDITQIKIEGFITAEDLGKCEVIKKGDFFPNTQYPSRCDNWLTYFFQYQNVDYLLDYLKNT